MRQPRETIRTIDDGQGGTEELRFRELQYHDRVSMLVYCRDEETGRIGTTADEQGFEAYGTADPNEGIRKLTPKPVPLEAAVRAIEACCTERIRNGWESDAKRARRRREAEIEAFFEVAEQETEKGTAAEGNET